VAIWPWKTRDALIETNEWLTDVIRTKNSEQRFSQRQSPRQSFQFSHTFNEIEFQAAKSIIRQNTTLQVPDWTLSIFAGEVLVDSSPQINYTEAVLYAGDQVAVWESPTKYESATIIDRDSGAGYTLDALSDDYDKAYIAPLRSAQAPEGLQAERRAGKYIQCQIQFDLTDSRDIGQSDYATYRGDDIISDCPVISGESFNDSINWPIDAVDNGIGYPDYFVTRNTYDAFTVMRWHVFNRSSLYTLRRFVHSRRGKWKRFWLPSFKSDFVLAQQISMSDGFVVVYAPEGITDLGMATFDIEIAGQYLRRVTSYSDAGFSTNGRAILQLNIDSVIGVTLASDSRISMLRHLRFNSDRVEFNHQYNSERRISTSASIPCIEVNYV